MDAERPVFQTLFESAAGAGLPEWPRVQAAIQLRRHEPGAQVFGQDQAHAQVYAVRRGLLKLCYDGEDGSEWIKSFASEGGFFASIAALQPQGRTSFSVVAIEPCTLERLDHALLLELSDRHLAWARVINVLTMAFAARKEQRERELLTLRPEARYRIFRDRHPALERRVPQKDLARYLGLTPVGLNRIVMRVRRDDAAAA